MNSYIGQKVYKESGKPFKSTNKINTVKGMTTLTFNNKTVDAFTFVEDDSAVESRRCKLVSERDTI